MQARQRTLLHAFSTFKLGGPQARFAKLANAFGADFRHLVVAMDGNHSAGAALHASVPWQVVEVHNRRGGGLANRGALRIKLREIKPDLLITYNWGAIEWAAANLPGLVPQVHIEDGFGPEEASGQLPRRVLLRRLLLAWPQRPLLVPSETLRRIALERWSYPARLLQHVPNGVPVPHAPKQWKGWPQGRPRIGTLAVLRAEKNLPRLLRAFAALRQTRPASLHIIGDGPERPALEALALSLGLQGDVEFAGHQSQPLEALRHIDLFAISSDTEQLPISLLESLSLGVPAIGTRVGDVGGLLDALEPGWTSAPDDAAFSALLQQACQRTADWPALGAAGRRLVEQEFSEARMMAGWRQLFDGGRQP